MYGAMSASKSAQLLFTAHNFEEKGQTPILIKPNLDTRSGKGNIESRAGLSHVAEDVSTSLSYKDTTSLLNRLYDAYNKPDVILVDECQFFGEGFIKATVDFSRKNNIDLIAYGLLKTFKNELFSGSKVWVELVDDIKEVKTVCQYKDCKRKATRNGRLVNGKITTSGDTVVIGDEQYISLCAEHYESLK